MINTLRYSMLGKADINPEMSLLIIACVGLVLLAINYRLFKKGYKLRA
jgi:hypothetical protein